MPCNPLSPSETKKWQVPPSPYLCFSPQLAEGAYNSPPQVIDYNLIEREKKKEKTKKKCVNTFLLYFIKKIFN